MITRADIIVALKAFLWSILLMIVVFLFFYPALRKEQLENEQEKSFLHSDFGWTK